MTPAMADEPYCAAAPSRSTSMLAIALIGIALRSTGEEPRPSDPSTLRLADVCCILPLISTSVSSGDRPRNCAGWMASVASVMEGCGKLNDGSRVRSAPARLVAPVEVRSFGVRTSIGDIESASVRSNARVPVTTIVCNCFALDGLTGGAVDAEDAFCACAAEAARAAMSASVSGLRCRGALRRVIFISLIVNGHDIIPLSSALLASCFEKSFFLEYVESICAIT